VPISEAWHEGDPSCWAGNRALRPWCCRLSGLGGAVAAKWDRQLHQLKRFCSVSRWSGVDHCHDAAARTFSVSREGGRTFLRGGLELTGQWGRPTSAGSVWGSPPGLMLLGEKFRRRPDCTSGRRFSYCSCFRDAAGGNWASRRWRAPRELPDSCCPPCQLREVDGMSR